MKYKHIKGTNIDISQLNLGTMMFGGQTSEAESLAIMDYAFDAGINLFDTANIYNNGESERVVGKGIKGRRDKIILATKVGYPMGGDLNEAGLKKDTLLKSIDASLGRLNTDYVDLYYLHAPDYETPIEETLEGMEEILLSGKARHYGISNFAAWQIAELVAACDKYNFTKPVITQNVYNLITRSIEAELIPYLQANEMALTVYNPIAAGLLAGKHKPGQPADNTRFSNNEVYYKRYWSDASFKAIDRLIEIGKSHDLSLLELAMNWCADHRQVTSIISGVSKLSQLEQNIKALKEEPLSDEIMKQCDEVWLELTGNRFGYNR